MAKKEEPVKTIVWVFWILIAIIGVGMLYTGIQGSVLGDNLTTSIMLVVVGIVLLFIGLIMVLGKANSYNWNNSPQKRRRKKIISTKKQMQILKYQKGYLRIYYL